MKREDLALKDFCWSSGRLSSEKITHHRKSWSRTGNAELILRRLDEKQICRQQNLQWQKCHAFISFFFFFYPSAPKVHGYKGSWQDFYCTSVMIATERSYKNIVQVLHRWFTPSGEASPADGVSLMQRTTADQERLLPAPEYKCPFKKKKRSCSTAKRRRHTHKHELGSDKWNVPSDKTTHKHTYIHRPDQPSYS